MTATIETTTSTTSRDFAGKRVCVTGAVRGIGQGVAEAFLRAGARVALNYRTDRPEVTAYIAGLTAQYGQDAVLAVRADVADFAQVQQMFDTIKQAWGGLDVLVNNAGVNKDGLALMMSESSWGAVIETDLTGTFYCARQAAWLMAQTKSGVIVNVSSVSAFTSPAGQSNYAAAKAGVNALTATLAKELGKYRVRVNAIAPGLIETEMAAGLTGAARKAYLDKIPGHRLGTVAEVAAAVLFLASDQASYVNGHCLTVDGGLTA